YVESLRKSKNKNDFIKQLVGVRYIDGDISYQHRKHFFTDWSSRPPLNAKDITAEISAHTLTVTKYLNQKSDGGEFIPTLGVFKRDVSYIPAEFINDSVIDKLRTGDYIGIYTHIAGLDVTHTGIFIMTKNGPVLRNASSLKVNEKVVDSPFIEYVKKTPGIIVLRAL
ncbi:N-acetylmuramoyl-L-alanine amidase-like domain-containing protein, partial [Yersinia pestis]